MVDKAWMTAIAALPRLGHLQRQIRRLLYLIHGPITTPELAGHVYARPTKNWHRYNVRRSATKFAERVGDHQGALTNSGSILVDSGGTLSLSGTTTIASGGGLLEASSERSGEGQNAVLLCR